MPVGEKFEREFAGTSRAQVPGKEFATQIDLSIRFLSLKLKCKDGENSDVAYTNRIGAQRINK